MRSDPTCSGYHYPGWNQWGVHNRFGAITHEVNSEYEAFEILTFQSVKYSAFLKEDEEREQTEREQLPGSSATDPPRL